MKIEEAASAVYGISKQYLYRSLKKKGISADSLRDELSGEITEEGWQILDQHFARRDNSNVLGKTPVPPASIASASEDLRRCREDLAEAVAAKDEAEKQLAQVSAQVELLKVKLEGAETIIKAKDEALASSKQMVKQLQQDSEYLKAALAAAQQTQMITMARLPAPSQGNWFTNLFKPKQKQPETQQAEGEVK